MGKENLMLKKKLILIQNELRAPKNQYNNFGKYKYRNQEDILEAVKPILKKYECSLWLNDEVEEFAGIPTIKATATLTDGEDYISVNAYAGIDPHKKGMDISQTFGASSSYARKYALNGLFLIDDTKDADSQDNSNNVSKIKPNEKQLQAMIDAINSGQENLVAKNIDKYTISLEDVKKLALASKELNTKVKQVK